MKKRWLRLMLWIPAAAILVLLLCVSLFHTQPARRFIFEQLRSRLLSRSATDIRASSLRFNLFTGEITLENLDVRSASAPNLPPIFQAKRVYLKLDILKAMSGAWHFEKVQVTEPKVHYFVGADGTTNLPKTARASSAAPDLFIARGEAIKGSFQIENLHKRIGATFPQWQLLINGKKDSQEHKLEFSCLAKSSIQYRAYTFPIGQLKLSASLQQDALHADAAYLNVASSELFLKGTVRNFTNPAMDLQINSNLNLKGIAQAMDVREDIAGSVSGTVQISGPSNHLQISAKLKGEDVKAAGYREANFDLSGRAEWDSGKAMFHSVEFSSSEGSLRGSGEFVPESVSGTSTFKGEIRNLNLFPLWKRLKPPFDLASRGAGSFALKWNGAFSPSKLTGHARLNLSAARAEPTKYLLPASGTLDIQMQSGDMLVNLESFTALSAQLTGQFSLRSFREIQGNFHGEASNAETLIAQTSLFLGGSENPTGSMRLTGPIEFNAQASGRLKQPTISLSAQIRELQAGPMKHLSATVEARFQADQITFQSAVRLPQAAPLIAQGTLDLASREPALVLDAHGDHIPATAISKIFDNPLPFSGYLQADLHISGPIDKLTGHASIGGNGLAFYREPLGSLDVDLRLEEKQIRSTRFTLLKDPQASNSNRIDAQFTYSLESDQFQLQANGKRLKWQQLELLSGIPIQGTWDFTASGSGTIEQPSVDIKIESVDFRIQQSLLGPVVINAALREKRLTVETVAPRLNIVSNAHITNESPFAFDGEVHVGNLDLSLLGLKARNGKPLTGNLETSLTGSGNLNDIAQSRVSAQIQNLRLQAENLELHTQGLTQAEYQNGSIEISSATIVSGNSKLVLSGRMPIRQTAAAGQLRLKGQLDLTQTSGIAAMPKGLTTAGIVDVDLSLAGTPQKPTGSGTITLDNGVIGLPGIPIPLNNIVLRAHIQDGSVVLRQADASWEQSKISFTGEFPFGLLPRNIFIPFFRKEGPAAFSLDIANLKPEVTGKLPPGMSGLISIHAEGKATGTDLNSLSAQIDFRDLSFRMNEISIAQKQPSTILVHQGIATISRLSLSGPDTSIEASGSAGFLPKDPLNLRLTGDLNAALLTFMSRDLKATGRLKIEAVVTGHRRSPSLSGLAVINGGKLTLRSPRVIADSLTARLVLDPEQISVQECKGTLNGGPMTLSGTIGYQNGFLNDVKLQASVQDFFFNFPEGLKSSSSGNLTITSSDGAILVSGNVTVQESSYREPFEVSSQLMSYLKEQQIVETGIEPDPLLDRVRLNIALRTDTPTMVQNNVAKVGGTANLRLVGPFREPSMVGRITLEDGGELVINQRSYYINRGAITLANQTRIDPELDIQAQTKVSNYDITLRLTGTPEKLVTVLSSEPPLSEPDIMSLLITGNTTSETQGREVQTARTQALSLLAGQAGEELAVEARRALHLSTFRIDPGLIASESDPGARLTIGQDITKKLNLIYSMNLTNGGDQIWASEYEIARRFTTQATKQQDNSYRFEFHHNLLFGGPPATSRSRTAIKRFEIGSIEIGGAAPFSDKTLLSHFKVKSGQKYDFQKIQRGLDRLRDFYAEQDRLEVDMRMHRETRDQTVDLNLNIDPGPVVAFSFEGAPIPSGVKEEVQKAWKDGVLDVERIDNALRIIRLPLIRAGFLKPDIGYEIQTANDQKTIRFQIASGTRYGIVPITFPGASEISVIELNNALDQADLRWDVFADPHKVVDHLHRFYRERGYLQAKISLPVMQFDDQAGTGQVFINIQEGRLFTIGALEFSGNHAFDYDALWSAIPTSSGSSYDPNTLQDAIKELEKLYHSKGYNDVSVTFRIVQNSAVAKADLTFYIVERRQSIIRDIAIEGNQDTSPDFVQRQLDIKSGDVLDFARINESRRRLYSSGVYASVDFQTEEMAAAIPDPQIKEVRVRIRIREIRPYRLQYGFFYDTERGLGGILEVENRNLLGRALDMGLKLRYDSDLKEARLYFFQPFVTKIHLKTDASAFIQRETRPAFSTNRIGFSLFQQRSLPRSFRLDYGYRYDHVRWNGLPPDPTIFQASVPVARLITTLTRDSRDSVLDATRGEFSSHSFEFGPRFLGSEIGFARYYGQYFRYVALDKFLIKPQKEKRAAPKKFVYAGALRLGLTTAFGDKSVISPERFFAGGGTTLRGFEQDRLGPLETLADGTVRPFGGEALFLFNNEIRFPIFGILHGVGFVDIGNVYPRISDFDFSLRKTAGAGLRLKIKYIPLRFDYGYKLDRRPGENPSAFFFSIGQAF